MTEAVLAIDLGTSSIKALLVGRHGSILARERAPHTTFRPSPDAAEQDPTEWWTNARQLISRVTAESQHGVTISGISVTGQMHGLVVHDHKDQPFGNAITWQDGRSAATLPDLLNGLPADHPANADASIAPGYQVASWRWLSANNPDLPIRTERMLLPKDELIFRLTGHHVTDPSDAVGSGFFDVATGSWDEPIIDAAGIPPHSLPGIMPSGSIAGIILPEVAAQLALDPDIPVIIAGADAAVAAFGAGAVKADQALLMLSTGCQILQPVGQGTTSGQHDAAPWPSANPVGLSRWLRVGTTLNGGNTIDWAHRAFALPCAHDEFGELDQPEEPPPSDRRGPVFVPYLDGERSPVSESRGSGGFIGLAAHHDSNVMTQAVIDGVTLGVADVYGRMGGNLGADEPLRVGGGGVHNRRWLDAISRTFARPLDIVSEPDLSAWGAARSAAAALGWIDPVSDPDCWLPTTERIAPSSTDPEVARSRLEAFRRIARATADLARNLPQ